MIYIIHVLTRDNVTHVGLRLLHQRSFGLTLPTLIQIIFDADHGLSSVKRASNSFKEVPSSRRN